MALTSLSFLEPGQQWPPPAEAERLDGYNAHRLLFEGKHERVFKDNAWRLLREADNTSLEIVLNWPKRLSTLWADLLVGETPRFKAGEPVRDEQGNKTGEAPEQTRLDELVKKTRLVTLLHEAGIDISRYGDAVFKVGRKDGKATVEGQPPAYWFPVVAPGNTREVRQHVLAWPYKKPERGGVLGRDVEVEYLKVEIHSKGRVEHRLYRLENGRVRSEAPMTEDFPEIKEKVVDTGVDEFLVVQAPGMRTSDRLFGVDDYTDLEGIVQEMEVRLAQISRILDEHADPNMHGPEGAITVDPRTGLPHYEAGGKFFPVPPGESPPGYLAWDGQLAAAFTQLTELKEQFYLVSETSPAAFGKLDAGLATSGTALRRLMQAPLAKVGRIRTRLDPVVKEVIELAAKLEDAATSESTPLENVQITWNDGLPDDEMEQAQIEEMRLAAGVSSKLSSIKRLDSVDDDEAQKELDRIKNETPNAPSPIEALLGRREATLTPNPERQTDGDRRS